MIIYNKLWLENLLIKDQIHDDLRSGDISPEELKSIATAYPVGFYSPNIFVRIGLFILTCIIASFSGGLFGLCFSGLESVNPAVWLIILGVASYVALEIAVGPNNNFRSGIDDALIWISSGLILGAFTLLTEDIFKKYNDIVGMLSITGFVFLLSLYLTLRFADRLMSAVCFFAFLLFSAVLWKNTGTVGTATLPFFIIVLSALSYISLRLVAHNKRVIYYLRCIEILQVVSLLILYLAGNYYVVEKIGTELYGYQSGGQYKVALPYFFWMWTVILPFVYIGCGVQKKNSILIRSGLILIAAAAFTFRNYYHVMAIETTLTIVGLVLLAISYRIIKYLKVPKNGFTYQDLLEDSLSDNLKIESLIVTAMPAVTPDPTTSRFGGGSFGGGGSSSDF